MTSTDDARMPSDDSALESPHLQSPPPEDTFRSSVRKAADFLWTSKCIQIGITTPYKNRRYVHLRLQRMYDSLVGLYAEVFASNWPHFKRTSDSIAPQGTSADDAQKLMAEIYISHWFLDLYNSVRNSVAKLTPVALTEYFEERAEDSSNEYDAFLAHLNSVIRPTHIVGCYEDTIFIPRFNDLLDVSSANPFGLDTFSLNRKKFRGIIQAIKDKRAGWRTATLSNDTVGRPVWLFDWFANNHVCAWFPKTGNYTSEDVMYAYIIGVACTPKLAHLDMDSWIDFPTTMDEANVDLSKLKLSVPRSYFGAYENDTYTVRAEKFLIPTPDETDDEMRPHSRKRTKSSRSESDSSKPSAGQASTSADSAERPTADFKLIQQGTYIYYARVILNSNESARTGALLGLLLDPSTHAINN